MGIDDVESDEQEPGIVQGRINSADDGNTGCEPDETKANTGSGSDNASGIEPEQAVLSASRPQEVGKSDAVQSVAGGADKPDDSNGEHDQASYSGSHDDEVKPAAGTSTE